jgi:hypothetical protein
MSRPNGSDTRTQRDHNPQGTKADGPFENSAREEAATSPSSPAGVASKVSPTDAATNIVASIGAELERLGPLTWQQLSGTEMTECVICEEREGTVLAEDGRLVCEICDGDRARGLVA